jgi:hypothetical protein
VILLTEKIPMNRGPRLIVECDEDFKASVEARAKALGFTSYKNYLVHLVRNDLDGLTKPPKEKKKASL